MEQNIFRIQFDYKENFTDIILFLEFYLTDDPSSIKYGSPNKSKMIGKGYEINLKAPFKFC